MNTPYHGVYFHLRISCEIVNCWERAWGVVGWEGPLRFAGEERGGYKDQAGQTHIPWTAEASDLFPLTQGSQS